MRKIAKIAKKVAKKAFSLKKSGKIALNQQNQAQIIKKTQFIGVSTVSAPTATEIKVLGAYGAQPVGSAVIVPKGSIYWNGLVNEYRLHGIRGQMDLLLHVDKHAHTKNSPFLLFMAEFNGMVREAEEERQRLSLSSNNTFAFGSTTMMNCATTISMVNWPKTVTGSQWTP